MTYVRWPCVFLEILVWNPAALGAAGVWPSLQDLYTKIRAPSTQWLQCSSRQSESLSALELWDRFSVSSVGWFGLKEYSSLHSSFPPQMSSIVAHFGCFQPTFHSTDALSLFWSLSLQSQELGSSWLKEWAFKKTQAIVFGIWGSLVVWCRLCRVEGWSSVTEVRTFAEPAMVFILLEFLDEEEFGVRSVPEGLSQFSWKYSYE